MAHRRAVDNLLSTESVWPAIVVGYEESDREPVDRQTTVKGLAKDQPKPSTYGEVTPLGARQLFYYMGMADDFDDSNPIVFCDMGSGVGKLVMQAYLELPRVTRSIGVELAPLRHAGAVKAWEELQLSAKETRNQITSKLPVSVADVELTEGDFLDVDLSKVSHIYISSLCFTEDMMDEIAKKIERDAPNIQCVATLRALPSKFRQKGISDRINYDLVYKTFGLVERTEYVEMSWTVYSNSGATVHIYTRPDILQS
jgi:hypothetical protein